MSQDIKKLLRDYANDSGYSHNDYADSMRAAAAHIEALERQLAEAQEEEWRQLLASDHVGMKVDYRGLLGQSRAALKRENGGLAEMLRQLEGHLTELGQRWYAGDTAAVDEILQLYCIEPETRAALRKTAKSGDQNWQLREGDQFAAAGKERP